MLQYITEPINHRAIAIVSMNDIGYRVPFFSLSLLLVRSTRLSRYVPEILARDIPMNVSGHGSGDNEGEDPGLALVVQAEETMEKRHRRFCCLYSCSTRGKVLDLLIDLNCDACLAS